MALVVLDAGFINVALPTIGTSLRVTPSQAIFAVSGYQTALVVGLLPSAHVAEKVGYRRLFLIGLAVFSGASMLCGFAPSLRFLVAMRMVQGLGGAAIMAIGIALLRFALGPDRLGRAIGWNALNVALCSAAGPILGALILSIGPWPWLFFAKLPVVAIALVASIALPRVEPTGQLIDIAGIALHAVIAGLFLLAAGLVADNPSFAIALFGLAFGLAVLLIRRERSRAAPIWPIDLMTQRAFRVSVIASIGCFIAQSAGILALPFYLQLGLDRGPASAGFILMCWPLTVAVTSSVASRLAERFGSAWLCVTGGAVLASGLLFSGLWPVQESIVPLAFGAALSGLGFGLFQVPNNRTMFLSAPLERSAAAGGMQGSARLIGQTIGALMIGMLLASTSTVIAPRLGLVTGAVFAGLAALVSVLEVPALSRNRHRKIHTRQGEIV